jgi:catechol 2,3-dioxygenase-like lactoylglutathione lyase family enzyme
VFKGIHQTSISTPNLERMIGFYRDLLGFEECTRYGWSVGSHGLDKVVGVKVSSGDSVMLTAGNSIIKITQYHTPRPRPAGRPGASRHAAWDFAPMHRRQGPRCGVRASSRRGRGIPQQAALRASPTVFPQPSSRSSRFAAMHMAPPAGLEPATHELGSRRSSARSARKPGTRPRSGPPNSARGSPPGSPSSTCPGAAASGRSGGASRSKIRATKRHETLCGGTHIEPPRLHLRHLKLYTRNLL